MNHFLQTAISAAKNAGEILVEYMGKVTVSEKHPRDLVTEADLAAQEAIEKHLLREYPDHRFIGEESLGSIELTDEYTWIVDPLDGTTNFVHQLRSFSVSIALLKNSQPIVGVVYDPICKECFYAMHENGAFLNDTKITVSMCEQMRLALLVTGFSPSITKNSIEAHRFLEVLGKAQSIRRLGSAALNLCYLATGRVDGYWASGLNAWDIAAGMLILTEAGGKVRGLDGEFDLLKPKFIASATNNLGDEIERTLNNAE
jgi:myo-inositol-1(or 4)-monophosphatase